MKNNSIGCCCCCNCCCNCCDDPPPNSNNSFAFITQEQPISINMGQSIPFSTNQVIVGTGITHTPQSGDIILAPNREYLINYRAITRNTMRNETVSIRLLLDSDFVGGTNVEVKANGEPLNPELSGTAIVNTRDNLTTLRVVNNSMMAIAFAEFQITIIQLEQNISSAFIVNTRFLTLQTSETVELDKNIVINGNDIRHDESSPRIMLDSNSQYLINYRFVGNNGNATQIYALNFNLNGRGLIDNSLIFNTSDGGSLTPEVRSTGIFNTGGGENVLTLIHNEAGSIEITDLQVSIVKIGPNQSTSNNANLPGFATLGITGAGNNIGIDEAGLINGTDIRHAANSADIFLGANGYYLVTYALLATDLNRGDEVKVDLLLDDNPVAGTLISENTSNSNFSPLISGMAESKLNFRNSSSIDVGFWRTEISIVKIG